MPTPSNQVERPASQLALFFALLILAALLLFFVMRAVTPLKNAVERPISTPTTTTPSPVTPTSPATTTAPKTNPDGKTGPTTPTSTPVTVVRPRPANALCDAQNFICVNTPLTNDVISNPTVVTGTAIAFENTVQWNIKDADGNLMARGTVMANAPDIGLPGAFEVRTFWDVVPRTASGTVEVYESSARDGSPIHVVTVPVRFSQRTSVTRALYFPPQMIDDNACAGVSEMTVTLPGTILPVEQTLTALLAAQTSELTPGLKTLIPTGTRLVSLSVVNGLAKVIMSRELEPENATACQKDLIRAQIRKTLLRFPSIRQVDLSVEGKTPQDTLR
ncbi:GerMN domain-containing protein [Patescibacteria group bacterium]|nr:GerMN domain-containing protein [Patescibacteria group bacterium]